MPSVLANCSSLLHLSVQGNELSGILPAAVAGLPRLRTLSLSHNNLSGPVPFSPSLRVIELGFNAFTDLDPPEITPFSSALQVLDLQENRLKGEFPSWLANVSTLRILDLSGNSFVDSLPVRIGDLWMLQELRIGRNLMGGEVPEAIRKCGSLEVLDLEENHFSGEIPEFLSEIKGMRNLLLGGNLFSGLIPPIFRSLLELEVLSLQQNLLIGNVPQELMQLGNLTVLNLSHNNFSGGIPDGIGNLQGLRVLNMSGNHFSGAIPSSIGGMLNLRSLDLSQQNLSGTLPIELFGLPNLEVLSLAENSLSGDVPEGFSSLLSLRYLNLTLNRFFGGIPPTLGFLGSLVVLSLSENNITGSIPAELSNCSNLVALQLRSNHLRGPIPADLSHLSKLQELDLSDNDFTEEVPAELSNCSALRSLRLDRNQLSGSIPESFSLLSNLTTLDLSANNLTGSIPANLSHIAGLKFLNLSHNRLEGEIPEVLGSRFNNPSDFAANRDLCGKPLEAKCKSNGDLEGTDRKRRKKKRLLLMVSIAASVACIVAICCLCFYILSLIRWRHRLRDAGGKDKKRSRSRPSVARDSGENGAPKLVMFNDRITYAETVEATRHFDEENVLSRGRHGLVFKACFHDGAVLSIRRLPDGSTVDEGTFRKEAESLGKVKHRNLTVLRGYYIGPPEVRLLVYDYMPNGNLVTLLQEASLQDGHVLNWPMRHLIALGVARGLAFLHGESMVHGDVKPQNVLFDADFEAHLSDFGLEKLFLSTAAAEASTSSLGSLGYVAPEAALMGGQMSREADVYSFGIVLLELLTGKRPVMFTEDEDIVKWVKRQLQRGQISELLEPGLLELDPESSDWEEFLLGVKVGLLCTAPDPLDRPSMADVVFMLEGCRVGPDMPSSADPTSLPSPV